MKGDRFVAPESLRKTALADLHAAHQGLARTKSRACQIVFWPGITAAIKALFHSCLSCRTHQASLAKEPLLNDRQPSLPFEFTSADLFSCQGREFLVYVDGHVSPCGHVSQQLASPSSAPKSHQPRSADCMPCLQPDERQSRRRTPPHSSHSWSELHSSLNM